MFSSSLTVPIAFTSDEPIAFSHNGALSEITHEVDSPDIGIDSAGTYAVWYTVTGAEANQFTLFRNDNPVPGSTYGTETANTGYTGMVIINAAAGDQ
jgi:hypothetical protein